MHRACNPREIASVGRASRIRISPDGRHVDPEVGGAVRAALRGESRRVPVDATIVAASSGVEGVR